MPLDFPSNPVNGQVYDNFVFDAVKGTWKSLSSGSSPNYLVKPTITDAVITATAPTSSVVPITINGASSQTANLQEFKNSSGNVVSSVTSLGYVRTPGLRNVSDTGSYLDLSANGSVQILSRISSVPALTTQAASGQTAAIQQWQNSSGTNLSYVDINGLYVTPNTPYFSATRSGNFAGYNPSNQSNVIIYNSVDRNIGNGYNSSTGKFTAPLTGTYVFTVGVYQSQNVSQIWPVVNGARQQSFIPTAASPNWAASGTQYLAAGDNIGFCAWSDGSTNVTVYENGFHTFVRGTYIG